MKSTLTLFLSILSLFAFAQMEHLFSYDMNDYYANNIPLFYAPAKDISQINFTVVAKNGKVKKYQKDYTSGNKLKALYKIKDDEKQAIAIYKFDENYSITSSEYYANGKLKSTITYQRDEKLNPILQEKKKANGNPVFKNTWTYNEDGCLAENERFRKGKLADKFVNEYYSPCEKSKMTKYNRKGKVKQIWTYDCKKEGEILQKKKDVTQVCKWEESDANFLIKIYQTYDEKGRLRKNIRKYTKADTLLVEYKQLDENNVLTYHATYNKDNSEPIRILWYKYGKIRTEINFSYQGDLKTSYSYKVRGKLKEAAEYVYNENNLLVKFSSLDKKGASIETINLAYE